MLPPSLGLGRAHVLGLVLVLLVAIPVAGALVPPAEAAQQERIGCDHATLRAGPPTRDLPAVDADLGLGAEPAPRDHPFSIEECVGQIRPARA